MPTSRLRALPLAAVSLLLSALLGASIAGAAERATAPRLVSIGDIHGAYEQLVEILREADLIDEDLRWAGGDTVLVQLGDFTDRGTGVRAAMDLLMDLQEQAPQAGGEVIVLLGNHEAMNLFRIVRDVTPEIFATFAGEDAEGRRQTEYERWVAFRQRHGDPIAPPGGTPEDGRRRWMEQFPPGYFEYMDAFGPEGRYGSWLRRLPTVVRIGDVGFVHGGLSPEVAHMSFEEINAALWKEIRDFDGARERLLELELVLPFYDLREILAVARRAEERLEADDPGGLSPGDRRLLQEAIAGLPTLRETLSFGGHGPLWYRGYRDLDEEAGETLARELTERYGVERIVVAHSPPDPPSDIQLRFGGRVLLTDTGMRPGHYPGGRPSALEIADGAFTAIYPGERHVLLASEPETREAEGEEEAQEAPPPGRVWRGPDGEPLPFQTDAEALDFLASARIVDETGLDLGVTASARLRLEREGVEARALFKTFHEIDERVRLGDGTYVRFFRDTYLNEMAAFELSRYLGMELVPPTVQRRVGRQTGIVQLWIEKATMEMDRREQGLTPPDQRRWLRELAEMRVFDNLINNIDRNLGDMLFDPDWNLWLIDHSRSFGRERRLPRPEALTRCSRRLYQALEALDEETLDELLSPYMGRLEIHAVLARRDLILEHLGRRIAAAGAEQVLFDWDDEPPAPTPPPVERVGQESLHPDG